MKQLVQKIITPEEIQEGIILWLEKYGYLEESDTVDEFRSEPIRSRDVLVTLFED